MAPKRSHDLAQSHMSSVCALTDPFCPHAVGSVYPDGNGAYSVPFQSRYFVPITTDANGNAAELFDLGWPGYQLYIASSINATTGVATFAAAITDPNYATFVANFESYRVVSAGIRVMTTMPWTTAQGVYVTGLAGSAVGAGVFPVNNPGAYLEGEVFAVRDAEIFILGRPMDKFTARTFQAITSSGPAYPIYLPIFVGINGGTATSVVGNIEVVINYEFRTLPSSAMNQMSTLTPADRPALTTISNQVATRVPPFVIAKGSSDFGQKIGQTAMSVLEQAGSAAITAIGKEAMSLLAFI
jgi:hypothetical protein